MSVWEKFEDIASAEEVVEQVLINKPVPVGDYNVLLKKLAPSESRGGLPMIKGEFQMVDGGRKIFYNQLLMNTSIPELTAKNIAQAVEFLSGLVGEEIEFTSMADLESLIYEIELDAEYVVNVSFNEKRDSEHKFPILTVVEKVEYGTTEF